MSGQTWHKLVIPSNVLSTFGKLEQIKNEFSLSISSGECTANEAIFCREDSEIIEIYFTPGAATLALRFGAVRCPVPMPDERTMKPFAQFRLDALSAHLPDHKGE